MRSTFRLGKIAGIDIGIHYTWFFILALVTWSLASASFPSANPNWGTGLIWGLALISALLLFASVLIHELAHSIVAKSMGFPVEGITLFLLGGVSNLMAEARHAKEEFLISIVGPATSLVLALIFVALLVLLGGDILESTPVVGGAKSLTPLQAVLGYLWLINLLLAIFNMLPAFPLDGGRVFRSIIWGFTDSLGVATKIAGRTGQVIGFLMIAYGIFIVVDQRNLEGLWLAFVGWFVQFSAGSSLREMEVETVMRGMLVRDVMRANPTTIPPTTSVYEAVYDHLLRDGVRALPVCEGNRLVGILSLTDIRGFPQEQWQQTSVRDKMTSAPLRSVMPNDELMTALDLLGEYSVHQAPVLEGDTLVGLLSRADIIEYLHRRKELGLEPERSSTS